MAILPTFDAVSLRSHANPASVYPSEETHAQRQSRRGFGTLVLGGVLAGMLISYYVALETTCSSADPNEGAGELVITRGGTAKGTRTGTRFLAPLFVDATATLAENGTTDAELVWVEDLCENVLDCSTCPMRFSSGFNASTLRGKILLYDINLRTELYMCGQNRLGRTLGAAGLVGVGTAGTSTYSATTPGYFRKMWRYGEARDAKPRDGDAGIPFPLFMANQGEMAQFLLGTGLATGKNAEIRAAVMPTAPNPWQSTFCGYWKPLRMLLMLGHVGVAERSVSNLIGNVRTSGLRLDLAQLALGTETVAHFLMVVLHHDPYAAFHWAAIPFGGFAVYVFGAVILSCTSTLLLAAFWCVQHHRKRLESPMN